MANDTTGRRKGNSVIALEYVRAIVLPAFQAAFQHDDWVSSISVHGGDGGKILSGWYEAWHGCGI